MDDRPQAEVAPQAQEDHDRLMPPAAIVVTVGALLLAVAVTVWVWSMPRRDEAAPDEGASSDSTGTEPEEPMPVAALPVAADIPAAPLAAEEPAAPSAMEEPAPGEPGEAPADPLAGTAAEAEAPGGPAESLQREMALIQSARAVLSRDPEEALLLVEQAGETAPNGQFVEERTAIAVEALVALGRQDDARARGESFLVEHPEGAFADRVRTALGR